MVSPARSGGYQEDGDAAELAHLKDLYCHGQDHCPLPV